MLRYNFHTLKISKICMQKFANKKIFSVASTVVSHKYKYKYNICYIYIYRTCDP